MMEHRDTLITLCTNTNNWKMLLEYKPSNKLVTIELNHMFEGLK